MSRIFASLGGLAFAVLSISSNAIADDADLIETRQRIMRTLDEQVGIVGQIASGAAPADNLNTHLEIIALTAATALKSFEPKVNGGESKPQVWSDWADFAKRMNEFAKKTQQLAKTGKDMGKEAAIGEMVDALTCKQCHDDYRQEKKR
jgi:cytochrome c556